MKIRSAGSISALIYLGTALLAAALFIVATSVKEYDWVARIGGAVWVFVLTTIVLMPVIIPLVKKKHRQ